MKKELLDKLYEKLPVSIKPGGQGFKYIKTKNVIDRLNRVFEGNWSTEIVKAEKVGNEYLVEVRVSRLDEKGQTLNSHSGFGSAKHFNNAELGNLYKSAKSRAIKDAAKSFGVGLLLNTSSSKEEYVASNEDVGATIQNIKQERKNIKDSVPPTGFSGVETAPLPTFKKEASNFPTEPPCPSAGKVEKKDTSNMSLPNMSPPTNLTTPGSVKPTPMNMPNMNGDESDIKITSIQKIVLDMRFKESKKDFKSFITEQFASVNHTLNYEVNSLDDILYKDALLIVSN